MPVRRVLAHDAVEDDGGRVALQRGPLVYCAEGVDHAEGRVLSLLLADDTRLVPQHETGLLGGVTVLHGRARLVARGEDGTPELRDERPLTAIPYYAWAHRELGEMAVWLARELGGARPLPAPTLARRSKVRASGGTGIEALNDQLEPGSSIDHRHPFFHWGPRKGTTEWIEYDALRLEVHLADGWSAGVHEWRVR